MALTSSSSLYISGIICSVHSAGMSGADIIHLWRNMKPGGVQQR